MLKEEDIMHEHVYHITYFQNLYKNYYSAKISQQSLINELSKIYLDETDFKLKGFNEQNKKEYEIQLNEIIIGLIRYVNSQFDKMQELNSFCI